MKKISGIIRNKNQQYQQLKGVYARKKNRFKIVGKEEQEIHDYDIRSSQNSQNSATTRNSYTLEIAVQEYTRNKEIYCQAKQYLKKVLEIRNKISFETKGRMTAFKQSEMQKYDDNIYKLSTKAVDNILKSEKCLNVIRNYKGNNNFQQKYYRNMQRSLAEEIRNQSKSLRKQQKDYFQRLKAYDKGAVNFAIQLNEEQKYRMRDQFEQVQLQNEQGENKERNIRINQLIKSINHLSTIYKELNQLVIQQGSIIDRIDINIDETLDHIKIGNENLRQAEQHVNMNYAQKCMIILLVAVVIAAIILGFKYSSH